MYNRYLIDLKKAAFALIFLSVSIDYTFAQNTAIVRDTSFTINSEYRKQLKKFPQLAIAMPVSPKGVKAAKDISYCEVNNRKLKLDVFYPAKRTKTPVPGVLLIHGGGWRSGDKSQQIPLAEHLASKGYVAVTAEYRLSPEATYPAAIQDLREAVCWMRANAKEYNLDTAKIAALGCSAGGQLAALMGTTNENSAFQATSDSNFSGKIQAVINIDGILAFIHPESEESAVAAQWLGGTAAEKPEIWQQASPLNHTDKNSVPIAFINSAIPRFHAGREDMKAKLDQLGVYHVTHTLADTPHTFWLFHPWFDKTNAYIIGFLEKIFRNNHKQVE